MTLTVPWRPVLTVGFIVLAQLAGVTMLTRSDGFRAPAWTAGCLIAYLLANWALARAIAGGTALSIVMPVLSALVPLGSVLVAITLLGEKASWSRLGLLTLACLLVGAAARV